MALTFAAAGEGLTLFPNPVAGTLNVRTTATAEIPVQLFDARGRLLQTYRVPSASFQIDLADLAPGIYFLRHGVLVEKVLVL